MARLPRLYAPDIPQLALVNFAQALARPSDPTPAARLDRLALWLREIVLEQRAVVHGWVLLNDRLVLLATPAATDSLARLIQAFGRRYASRLQHGRVFEGRYRSALVQPGQWILPCLIWLDRLPVQLGYVDKAEAWPWSSGGHHTGTTQVSDSLVSDHPDYWSDGNTPFERQARFRQRLAQGLAPADVQQIERALFGQWALGTPDFLAGLNAQASRRLTPATRGRPKKAPDSATCHDDTSADQTT